MLFAAHWAVSENRTLPVKTLSLIIFLSLIHSSFYWYMNSTTDAALKRYDSLFDARTLSQNGFYGASLQLSMYYHQVNDSHEPVILWKKYAARFPNDERGTTNIINNLSEGADDTTILRTYKQWYINNPNDTTLNNDFRHFTLNAGKRFFDNGKLSEAEECFRNAAALDSLYPKPFNNLGSVLAVRGKLGDAVTMFEKAVALDSTYGDALYNLGSAYTDGGNKKLGITYLQRAAHSGNKQAQLELQRQKITW
jgi:Flp pilus assembly protein TadD